MQEVAKLFAGIFLTIIPVIAMLKAGVNGPFGAIVAAVTRPDGSPDPAMYFWATGALSSFLDNAPTYLVFFNTAGGDPAVLMTTLAPTLAAISAGPCSWAPTPTSAMRPTSWSRPLPKTGV
jgi:Na+/H+ antiporter NhaD/arsenite permease-like protein